MKLSNSAGVSTSWKTEISVRDWIQLLPLQNFTNRNRFRHLLRLLLPLPQ